MSAALGSQIKWSRTSSLMMQNGNDQDVAGRQHVAHRAGAKKNGNGSGSGDSIPLTGVEIGAGAGPSRTHSERADSMDAEGSLYDEASNAGGGGSTKTGGAAGPTNQTRRDQNRIAQREFRARKQQHVSRKRHCRQIRGARGVRCRGLGITCASQLFAAGGPTRLPSIARLSAPCVIAFANLTCLASTSLPAPSCPPSRSKTLKPASHFSRAIKTNAPSS